MIFWIKFVSVLALIVYATALYFAGLFRGYRSGVLDSAREGDASFKRRVDIETEALRKRQHDNIEQLTRAGLLVEPLGAVSTPNQDSSCVPSGKAKGAPGSLGMKVIPFRATGIPELGEAVDVNDKPPA